MPSSKHLEQPMAQRDFIGCALKSLQDFPQREPLSSEWSCSRAVLPRACAFNQFFKIIHAKFCLLVKSPFFRHGNGQL
jgi:hypothetical protein